jgi:carbon-monoxide dehydrogenase medium subunit
VIPPAFEYVRAESVDEALAYLGKYGSDARLLAGGHSLLPLMRLRLASPRVLIDIGRIRELAYVRAEGDELAVGALATHDALERSPAVAAAAPALGEAAGVLGDPQVRNRGTFGGELAHADPAADYGAVVLALGGAVTVAGPGGRRTLAIDDWYTGPFTTALGPGEMLLGYRAPAAGPREGSVYRKFARRASDYGMVGVAVRLRLGEDGRCAAARIALGCVSDRPVRAKSAEAALVGAFPEGDAVRSAAALVLDGVDVADDPFCPADYRRALAQVETARAIAEAAARARAA